MKTNKILTILGFLLALFWGAHKLEEAATRLQFEILNKPVLVKVVELPICGRSNIIGVGYQNKTYNISINKIDCLQGKYNVGDTLEATYNSKLDEMNPNNFAGVYRLYIVYITLVGTGLLLYLFLPKTRQKLNK